MASHFVPSNLPVEPNRDPSALGAPQAYPPTWGAPPTEEPGIPWTRYLSALRRFKWLILLVVMAGTAAGAAATHFMTPEYQVQSTIWISDDNGPRQNLGPVQGSALLTSGGWADLLKSSAIMDKVVQNLSLYLWPTNYTDSAVLANFEPGVGLRTGTFVLKTDAVGTHYTLTTEQGAVLESGTVGDSIGRQLGFLWQPAPATLGPSRVVEFTVANPRNISVGLANSVQVFLPERSQFLRLSLTGKSPHRTARILNAITAEFVNTAGELKRRNLTEEARTLATQLDSAKRGLDDAESALQHFRTSTITEPNEATQLAAPPGGAIGTTPTDPVVGGYFGQKIQLENLKHDEEALRYAIRDPNLITADAFISIPSAQQSPDLQAALADLSRREAALRAAREQYTDQHKIVQDLKESVQALRTQTVPVLTQRLIATLQKRENDLNSQLGRTAADLKKIPARSIEQMQLQSNVQTKASIYSMLQQRYEEAKLAEASAIPDVSVLDSAVAPLYPTKNTAPRIILLAAIASLGGAVGLALLLDHTDPRFRYPEQVTDELGLTILGAVPSIKRSRGGEPDPEEAAQVIEAFRTIRMALTNQYDASGPIMFTVSSPGAGDGKSLVSSNLALSFAEAGYRTVLVDGDTRRGQLHAMFGANRRPGLLDCLGGDAPLDAVLRSTTHERLTLVPCGTRRHRGPELLHSQAMSQFIAELRRRYDVVLVDSPPLGAGVDPFVLGAATGNMLIVLRRGATDRKMAETKLKLLDRLPIRLLGAVLNDIRATGEYKYYSYLYGYTTSEDDELPRLAPRVGELTGQI